MSFLNKVMNLGRRQDQDQTDDMPFDDGYRSFVHVTANVIGAALDSAMRLAVERLYPALAKERLLKPPRRHPATHEPAFVVKQLGRRGACHANR